MELQCNAKEAVEIELAHNTDVLRGKRLLGTTQHLSRLTL